MEFSAHSADDAIATMVPNPLVNQVPVMIGGDGKEELHHNQEVSTRTSVPRAER
jgi:hypothetical protein